MCRPADRPDGSSKVDVGKGLPTYGLGWPIRRGS